ncbi:hypothetical protein N0V83_001996 [Neocucurbitaria cava]|uniref:Uncharacterized protein n=1 Tax=Neocucurbitaria cava TaxID=798079 RepID=A0A9W9CQE1_9PLEO|nr:hypothetical protein N0V83_001996 [Neocucurbitaria cava]
MARTGRKRKFSSMSSSNGTTAQLDKQEKLEEHPAATFKPPKNPRATLSGLPTELRLQIYAYLCDASLIHVHRHIDEETLESRFTWTPCRSPSAFSPLLCANPKWSGMCPEFARCTHDITSPPEPLGFWGLAASSKAIRNEAQEFFLRHTVVSVDPRDLRPWLDHLSEHVPGQIDHLRRVTIAGPMCDEFFTEAVVQAVRQRVPKLEGLGIQCQDCVWDWTMPAVGFTKIERDHWKDWYVMGWVDEFDETVTVAIEVMVWRKRMIGHGREQQLVIRLLREGHEDNKARVDGGWNDHDVQVEIDDPGRLAEPNRYAKWRQWWNAREMDGFPL